MEGSGVDENYPAGLAERGAALWRETTESWQLTPAHLVLLEEACRIVDRLDLLNTMILRSTSPPDGDEAQLPDLPAVLAETRQQQGALRMIIAEIRQGQVGFAPTPSVDGEGSVVTDLSARIAEKKAKG